MVFKNLLAMTSRKGSSRGSVADAPDSPENHRDEDLNQSYVRVIDKDGNFIGRDISPYFLAWDLGSGYKIVTVIGWYNINNITTLTFLNRLFGCNLGASNKNKGGVWMCCAKDSKYLILFANIADIGTQRQTANRFNFVRFAVIVSDVLVIHFDRMTYDPILDTIKYLLRTIFTVHLRVFGLDSLETTRRLLLLFVGYPLEYSTAPIPIKNKLTMQAHQIWQHITASQRIQPQFLDYFDFNVMFHSVQIRPEENSRFRLHFTNRNHPNYLFKPQYHKNIPIDNLACLMESSWGHLKSRTTFDHITQQLIVSEYRSCVPKIETQEIPTQGTSDDNLNPTLYALLFQLRIPNMQSNAPTAESIDQLLILLKMKNYVPVALQIEDESDARLLLDLLLVALDHRPLLFNENVLDAPRRVRRLMFKLATKIPVLPPSLHISGINVNRRYAGWGGYADVFMGEYLGATVALKLLRTAKHNDFYREALVWRSLSHESVLPFLGIYEEEQMFLVSPFMKNGTLSQWRNVQKPATADVRKRLLEVAEGLQYIHSEGIVHGDIRGSNILLDGDFHAKIADFGLTRHFDATATQTDTLSPNFAAPELFGWVEDDSEASDPDDSAKIARTPRSDIYAFGSLYYEIHFNVIPFTGQDYIHILRQVTNKKRPEKLDKPALGDEEWKLVKQCWRHEQSRRPAMEDVVEIMVQWDMNSD